MNRKTGSIAAASRTEGGASSTAWPNWEALQALQAVLTQGSLSAAARMLGSSQPTVGRHIAALEAAWGVALFTRASTGLKPTEAALALAPLAQAMATQSQAMARVVEAWRGPQVQATVRISSSELMGQAVLPPLLARLQATHPHIRIELSLSNATEDVVGREVDLAVRMYPPQQAVLIAQRAGSRTVGLFARTDYLEAHGRPDGLPALAQHRLIGWDRQEPPGLPPAYRALWQRDRFALRCDDERAQWALVLAGAGIGVGQVALAAQIPGVERVLADEVSFDLPVWLCMHEDLRHSAVHALVFRELREGLLQEMAGPDG